ncbi:peptidyl-prolyl cis-trans isomerase CYP37, chloroplastic isoform X3 [Amborella trichopoda]|uniref:peptidyl-prolyl cis-trans isomerase CYP37, chloroplastic isoform X3 n=1 Tax=Amborella trichopoda TaxID=13333 RepID=UPI0005D39530|nr:peptidyl-prolyl cis-trans isomerase CYP37, chloroplastic isoform X3 [Amborella trichopoda]|eukprot:XP_011622319.1 peptidyl-prolyl cis-trans isomerase CYP37, chloroplastic isoform X3 [Amborella trichopoda]
MASHTPSIFVHSSSVPARRKCSFLSFTPLPFTSRLSCRTQRISMEIFCSRNHDAPEGSSHQCDSSLTSTSPVFCGGIKAISRSVAAVLLLHISSCALVDLQPWFLLPARAVLYSPDTKVPRTGELALRKAIPANPVMKTMQESLEDISFLLRIPQRKPYGTMEGDVKKTLTGGLKDLIASIKENDPDKISITLSSTLGTISELELLQAPGISYLLPEQYLKYPRLTGRGIVEFIVEKGDGSTFSTAAGGGPQKLATIQLVLDGYSAPLTAGNFAKLVIDGAYDGIKLKCTEQAILSDNELGGSGYSIPLEIMPSGQFEPLYKTTLDVQDGELPVLPLSVYGAVAMAHNADSEEYSSPSQFFIYLYDKKSAGLGGLSFDEGQFSVFGYTTVGREILSQLKTGDVIRSAKLVQGQERFVLPVSEG